MRFAFNLCRDHLGVDDPITWMNAVGPKVLDGWIAHKLLEIEEQEEGTKSSSEMMSPDEALQRLSIQHG